MSFWKEGREEGMANVCGCLTLTMALFKRKPKIESPDRIKFFREFTIDLDWKNKEDSLKKLYVGINTLAEAEIEYYYNRRLSKRRLSGLLRTCTLMFFGIGGLFPLIAGANSHLSPLNAWGYVILGIGAIFLSADKVFIGSSGHVRFVTTQLALEKDLTLFRLKWQKLLANYNSANSIDEFLDELEKFSASFYETILNETDQWKGELAQAIEELKRREKGK